MNKSIYKATLVVFALLPISKIAAQENRNLIKSGINVKYIPFSDSGSLARMEELRVAFTKDSIQGKFKAALAKLVILQTIKEQDAKSSKAKHVQVLNKQYNLIKAEQELLLQHQAIALLARQKALDEATITKTKSALQVQKAQFAKAEQERRFHREQNKLAYDLLKSITAKREIDLKLSEKNAEVQFSLLKRAQILKWLVFVIVVILLVLGVFLYKGIGARKRTNKQLKNQQLAILCQNISLQRLSKEQHNLIEEKELLIREIHHRVKNNLQVVSSLLNVHGGYHDGSEAVLALRENQCRMYAVSLVHQKIYHSANLVALNLNEYIPELIEHLIACEFNTQKTIFQLDILPVFLDVRQAVPLALIINEMISNALKHATPVKDKRIISIKLTGKERQFELKIKDNGPGMKDLRMANDPTTMGMNLVKTFLAHLGAQYNFINKDGLVIHIVFATIGRWDVFQQHHKIKDDV